MIFKLLLSSAAEKDLKKLEHLVFLRIDQALLSLVENPYKIGTKSLKNSKLAEFRIRVGDFRILYDVYNSNKTVYILRIGHRKDIYK